MGLSGLEPPTSRLSGVRSNRLSYKPNQKNLVEISGIEPLTYAVQVRRSPNWAISPYHMVRLSGLEPPTSRLSGVCSNQLSYKRIHKDTVLF